MRPVARTLWCVAAVAVLGACVGEGSDIGPNIPRLPEARYQLLLQNDAGAGVCNAFGSLPTLGEPAQPTRRSGRVDLFVAPNGRLVTVVDASLAKATDDDRLANLAFAANHSGIELPFVVYLPDLAPSAGVSITSGVQASSVTLDDSGTSGAVVTIPAGAAVALPGASSALLQSGLLAADHLPPVAVTGVPAVLTTRGAFVSPAELAVDRGATISLPNDVALAPGATARLFRLDAVSGEWQDVGVGTVDPGGSRIESAPGTLSRGGLHCFVREVSATASLMGRVLRSSDMTTQPDVLIRADQVFTVSESNGQFVLEGLPVVDGPRDVTVTFTGGANLRPSSETRTFSIDAGATVDVGDVTVHTSYVVDLRLLLINRGAEEPWNEIGAGSTAGLTGGRGVGDGDARLDIDEVDTGYVRFSRAVPSRESFNVYATDGISFVSNGQRNYDIRLFDDESNWVWGYSGGSQCWFIDELTGALIDDAYIFLVSNGVDFNNGRTSDGQVTVKDFGFGGEATISVQTASDGRTVTAAFSTLDVEGGRVEQPVPRANRLPLGQFVPFAWASGSVPGTGALALAVTPAIRPEIWLDAVFDGHPLAAAVPMDLLPQVDGGDAFRVGVPPAGNVVGTSSGVPDTLDGFAFAAGVELDRSQDNALDLGASIPLDTDYPYGDAFVSRDPAIPVSAFAPSVALRLADGSAVEIARGIAGNLTANGADATVRLPALSGPLAGDSLVVALIGEADDGTVTRTQRSTIVISDTSGGAQALLPLPELVAPLPGAQVTAGGFELQFRLPADAVYGYVRFFRDTGTELNEWRALVPAGTESFRFRTLPDGPAVLVPGQWTVELTAASLRPNGPASLLEPFTEYDAVTTRFREMQRYERGLAAESTIRFQIELVP